MHPMQGTAVHLGGVIYNTSTKRPQQLQHCGCFNRQTHVTLTRNLTSGCCAWSRAEQDMSQRSAGAIGSLAA